MFHQHTHSWHLIYIHDNDFKNRRKFTEPELWSLLSSITVPSLIPRPEFLKSWLLMTKQLPLGSVVMGYVSKTCTGKLGESHCRRARPEHWGFDTYCVCVARHRRLRSEGALVFFWKADQGVTSPLVAITIMQ